MKNIKVLGRGCTRCDEMEEKVRAAAKEMGMKCSVEKVTDMEAITRFGVMMTPALVVDDHVKLQGRVGTIEEIKRLLA